MHKLLELFKKWFYPNKVYTRFWATGILDHVEDVLIEKGIRVPSDEDYEREPDDLGFYGTQYSELLDDIERHLEELLKEKREFSQVVTGKYGG